MGFSRGQKLIKKYEYDFAVDGGAVSAIPLRSTSSALHAGCHITNMYIITETLITSDGSPTMVIGNTTDADGYFADITALVSGSVDGSLMNGEVAGALLWDDTNDHAIMYSPTEDADDLDMNLTIGTAALTAGKFALYVEFFRG